MKLLEKEKAQGLRLNGLSLKQIAQRLEVSKGSVSAWVRNVTVPREVFFNINDQRRLGREQSRKTRLSNIARRNDEINAKCREEIIPLSNRDLWIAGLMLYAGEGFKSSNVSGQRVEIANSNPEILRIFINFLIKVCLVPKKKIKVRLMLYEDICPEEAKKFWSGGLGIVADQFCKPFIKRSYKDEPCRHLRRSKYGTAHVILCDIKVYKKIIGWLKAIYEDNNF
ncbi:MAG: hypothetical protein V1670_05330 [Candidatus Omnitrophota bacterium]